MDNIAAHDVVVRTPRLLLRCLRVEDAPDMFRWSSNPEVMRFARAHPSIVVSQSVRVIEDGLASPKHFNFAVTLLQESAPDNSRSRVIGVCGGHRLPEVGYMIDQPYWGKGYTTEALQAFLQTYWGTFPEGFPGLEGDEKNYLTASIAPENTVSVSVIRKCGFSRWKEVEVDDKNGNGKFVLDIWRLWRPLKGQET